jgi:hypothetical protein
MMGIHCWYAALQTVTLVELNLTPKQLQKIATADWVEATLQQL